MNNQLDIFGQKAKNIIKLSQILSATKLKNIEVQIPDFCPLQHDVLLAHLISHYPKFLELWNSFVESKKQSGSKDLLSESERHDLQELRQMIIDCFSAHPFSSEDLNDFLIKFSEDERLMIRSSAHEDAPDNANPGGNLSISHVSIDTASVSKAIGQVIASYFSEKSLLQRLSINQNIDEPFMPVLIQQMIREKDQENILVSGVLYVTDKGTTIQMAPGHGDYIVNAQGPFDTVHVGREDIIDVHVQYKPKRLIHLDAGAIYKPNAPSLASSLSLPQEYIPDVVRVGKKIYENYLIPMDIEFVFDLNARTLFLVQARPIVHSIEKEHAPSALNPKCLGAHMSMKTITTNTPYVRVISDSKQVILATTLEDALERYLHLSEKDKVQGILMTSKTPNMSHAAAFFSTKGILVTEIKEHDFKILQNQQKHQKFIWLLDPQRNVCLDWSLHPVLDSSKIEEELLQNEVIQKGLFSSSFSTSKSLLPFFHKQQYEIQSLSSHDNTELKSKNLGALIEIANGDDKVQANIAFNVIMQNLQQLIDIKQKLPSSTIYELLTQLKNERSEAALQILLKKLYTFVSLENLRNISPTFIQHLMIVGAEIMSAIQSIPPIHEQEWLDTVAKLELLIHSPDIDTLETNSISKLASYQKAYRAASQMDEFKILNSEQQPFFMLFYLVSSFAMNEETKKQWLQFSSAVSLNKKNCNILLKIILFLLKNDLLIPWLNTHFIEKKSLAEMSKDIFNIQKDLESFKLDDVLLTIQRWELQITQWENPDNFDVLIEQYRKDMLEALDNLDFMPFGAIEVDKEPKNLEEAKMMLKPYINGLIKTPESVLYVTNHHIKKLSIEDFKELISFQKSRSSFHFEKTSHLTELIPFQKTVSQLNQEALYYLLYNSLYHPHFIFDYSKIKPQADFTQLNILTQQSLLNTMLKLCHVMDSTIKSLKGSLSYNNDRNLQIQRLYQLLEIFLLPMNYCLIGLGQHPFVNDINRKFLYDKKGNINTIINPEKELILSKHYHPGLLINHIHFHRLCKLDLFPQSGNTFHLEDYFVLFHQNILHALSMLGHSSQPKMEQLPIILQRIHRQLVESDIIPIVGANPILVNIETRFPLICFNYFRPIRDHAAQFYISYDLQKQILRFNFKGMGMPSDNWLKLANLVKEETTLFNLELSKVPTESSPRFEWYFKDTEEIRSHLPPFAWMINHYCRLILREQISDEAIEAFKQEHLQIYQQQKPTILKFGR